MNKYRVTLHHIVFFIFVVSNVGGCLTPIGDPPLFIGLLRGVPFFWLVERIAVIWLGGWPRPVPAITRIRFPTSAPAAMPL